MQTPKQHPRGISPLVLVLILAGLALLAVFNTLFVLRQQAEKRDAIRIADMARLEAAFALLSFETSSYAEAAKGCGQPGALVSHCTLGRYLPTITDLKDPGKHAYRVAEVPSEKRFSVAFTLERGFDRLGPGQHTLTPDGIR